MQITNRREFLRTVVLTAASLVVVPQIVRGESTEQAFVDLGPDEKYAGGAWTRVVLPAAYNSEVIFVRKVSGQKMPYEALSARCTHRGCVVDYFADQHVFICPCHHGHYDDNGNNISGPPPTPLHELTTRVDAHDHLLVTPPIASGPNRG